jgi:galactose mutarotase-like enzyme
VIGRQSIEGLEALTIGGDEPDGLQAEFVPAAGMVGCSLLHRGENLLGLRGGLSRYIEERSTMGIPLLHPWANRLGRERFRVAGGEVDLGLEGLPVSRDPNGLPIHGLLAAASGWTVVRHEASDDGGTLEARFDFAADPGLIAAFPFPHELLLAVRVNGSKLTITTTVTATGEVAVPVSFGFHPYLRLAGVERRDWQIEAPVSERLELAGEMLPTGKLQPIEIQSGPLGSRTFDDGYLAPGDRAPFVLAGGGRRIELRVGEGYRFAQVYAPDDDEVIAFEPMTAPTNALLSGGSDLPLVEPGGSYEATFSIAVLTVPRDSRS